MKQTEIHPWLRTVELIGGEPCLDFVNSVADCIGPAPVEHLRSYSELLFWLERCRLLPAREGAAFLARARHHPQGAATALEGALKFRDAAWRTLAAVARNISPAAADLTEINRVVRKAYTRMALVPESRGFRLRQQGADGGLDQALWPVARTFAEFMTGDELGAVRMCASDTCGWLFVDRSRNHCRRWCSMSDCGNLAKQRRLRARLAAEGD